MKFCINSMLCLTFLCHARIYCGGGSVAAAAEEAEQVKEQVDEVKIEIQGAESGYMAGGRRGHGFGHAFDLLGVPCGQTDENDHTGKGYDPSEGAVGPEQVDHSRDNQSYQGHV